MSRRERESRREIVSCCMVCCSCSCLFSCLRVPVCLCACLCPFVCWCPSVSISVCLSVLVCACPCLSGLVYVCLACLSCLPSLPCLSFPVLSCNVLSCVCVSVCPCLFFLYSLFSRCRLVLCLCVRHFFPSFFLFDLVLLSLSIQLSPSLLLGLSHCFFQTRTHMKGKKMLWTSSRPEHLQPCQENALPECVTHQRCFGMTQAKLPPEGSMLRSSARSVSRSCRKPERRCGASQDPKSMASIDVFWSAAKTFSHWWKMTFASLNVSNFAPYISAWFSFANFAYMP